MTTFRLMTIKFNKHNYTLVPAEYEIVQQRPSKSIPSSLASLCPPVVCASDGSQAASWTFLFGAGPMALTDSFLH